jgi:aminobenzoyl-glutamate utilization protein B
LSQTTKKNALNWISENEQEIIRVSDEIWNFAELGYQEFKSSALIADHLRKAGFKIEMGVSEIPTAFVATYGSGKPVIGVMGEYDALFGLSQKVSTQKEPVTEGAPGHACGHNIHGTSGMAGAIAAKVAVEKEGIPGTIKFFGTPAEEGGSAKVFMVRAALFNGVDAVLSHHPSSMNTADLSSTLASNNVRFHFYGVSSHAAGSPEQGRSALDAVELMSIGVNFLREHIIQDARIHYSITGDQFPPNIVPSYARIWLSVRAPERDQLDLIYNRVIDIAKGAALMTGTTFKHQLIIGVNNIVPNRVLSEIVVSNMRETGSPKYTEEEMDFAREIAKTIPPEEKITSLRKSKRPGWEKLRDTILDQTIADAWNDGEAGGGSTDVSDVSWNTPTMEFGTSTFVLGTPGHSWQNVAQSGMGIGHKSLLFAGKTIALSVIDLLTKPELRKKAQDELKERLAGRTYRSPVPSEVKPPLDFLEGRDVRLPKKPPQ